MKASQQLRLPLVAGILLISSLFAIVFSCKKDQDKGFVEISDVRTDGKVKTVPVNFSGTWESPNVITLKNQSSENVHVKLALDSAGIGAISRLYYLHPSRFTLPSLEFDVAANGTKVVPLTLNSGFFSPDSLYGIGFKIESVSTGNVAGDAGKIIVKLDFRNKYDGRYKVTGTFTDYVAPTLTFYEHETDLISISANSVKMVPKDLGIPGYLILSGTSLSYYGSFGPIFRFDVATNKINLVYNYYGQPASNTRSAQMDATATNQWDPTTKALTTKFYMLQPSDVPVSPFRRVLFANTLLYVGPRF